MSKDYVLINQRFRNDEEGEQLKRVANKINKTTEDLIKNLLQQITKSHIEQRFSYNKVISIIALPV